MRYTIKHFKKDFPDDEACLDYIFNRRYGKNYTCPKCGKTGFYKVAGRKCYACAWCAYQLHPTSGTIFHKSSTKLTDWFFAIFLMSQSKNGVSAKELERHLGVTYKTAWRIQKQIRTLMNQDKVVLAEVVEVDETYVGGKRQGTRGRGASGKSVVIGATQRKGNIKAEVVGNMKSSTVTPFLRENVKIGTTLMTDDYSSYGQVLRLGYKHSVVKHGQKEYVRGSTHTNTIEGFWSQLKRSIHGTYHSVSPKYLQSYVNEFAYRYNQRNAVTPIFKLLLHQVVSKLY
jgi:transposase